MDSHVFRLMAGELSRLLCGARMEKIHGPAPELYMFTLFAHAAKRRLLLRCGRQHPLLFVASCSLPNPARPPAVVMRLRKYCAGKRLGRAAVDFVARRIAFPLLAGREEGSPGRASFVHSEDCRADVCKDSFWLLLDLRAGPEVLDHLPQDFGLEPLRPQAALVDSLCDRAWDKHEPQGPWRNYAVLTPLLRESLAGLEPMEGRALLADLDTGGGELFLYADASGKPCFYSAWPLPESVCKRRGLAPASESHAPWKARESAEASQPLRADLLREFPVLASIACVDEARFLPEYGQLTDTEDRVSRQREAKRSAGLLHKLDQEEERLRAMLRLRQEACLLQRVLWQYPAGARLKEVLVPLDTEEGAVRALALNPLLTLRENMARMFHDSARGARGLEHVSRRREEVRAAGLEAPLMDRKAVITAGIDPSNIGGAGSGYDERAGREAKRAPAAWPGSVPPPAAAGDRPLSRRGPGNKSIKHVARFLSSDGFTLLRGKNAEGNQALLKLGRPFDFWLHAHNGPSAHLIIRRSHPGEDVPERTLLEAAALVGKKSWQRNDAKAEIMIALLRHVHAVKGAEAGSVKVDALLRTLMVALDAEEKE